MNLVSYSRAWSACFAVLLLLSVRGTARAAEPENAAAVFDAAVEHFDAAQYEAAARAFLRADLLAPDPDTLNNALISAKKSNDHLLVTQIAERALKAHQDDPGLVARARTALAAAAVHLSLLTLSCSPTPCQVYLDGEEVAPGRMYVSPGTHRISAVQAGAEEERHLIASEKRVTFSVGTTYVFEIKVPSNESPETPADDSQPRSQEAPPVVPGDRRASRIPADRVVFYSAVTTTAILAGFTTWSGVNATRANESLPTKPNETEVRGVEQKVLRTDILLGAALVSGAFTFCWGMWGTDLKAPAIDVGVAWQQGPSATLGGRFQ